MRLIKISLFLLGLFFLGYVFVYPWLIPIEHLKYENPKMTAMMKYRLKQWEREGKKITIRQTWVPMHRISPYLIKAVLIAEDDKFYKHSGFDYEAIEKALEKNLKAGKIKYGGSTISQQVAKNLFLSPSKNPIRKIQEAILTYRLEKTLSKKRILEIYLNIAEWGLGIFGIEEASRFYYHKPASALTPWEAARLAAVLPNPLKYNPLSDSPFVVKRSRLIYTIMKKRGVIKEEYLQEVGEKGIDNKLPAENQSEGNFSSELEPKENLNSQDGKENSTEKEN
ncbi:MAG: monofunctional biosynthetic peptidoglycan transglycosylase [Caldimicrobium sp.]